MSSVSDVSVSNLPVSKMPVSYQPHSLPKLESIAEVGSHWSLKAFWWKYTIIHLKVYDPQKFDFSIHKTEVIRSLGRLPLSKSKLRQRWLGQVTLLLWVIGGVKSNVVNVTSLTHTNSAGNRSRKCDLLFRKNMNWIWNHNSKSREACQNNKNG